MADKKISQLASASTPLAGTEVLPIVQSSATVKVATDDLTVKNIRSNATSGILQVAGPAAASTRIMTVPDANFTAARTDAANSFTDNQTLSTGNLVVGTAGKGIDFSANTNAAGMTSELLTWYEEGTWTPTDASVAGLTFTGTSNNCFYTRVGNKVTCIFALVYPSTVSTAGAKLTGLPFTAKNTSSSDAGGYVTFTNSSLTLSLLVGANDVSINIYTNTGGSVTNAQLSTFILRGVVNYLV